MASPGGQQNKCYADNIHWDERKSSFKASGLVLIIPLKFLIHPLLQLNWRSAIIIVLTEGDQVLPSGRYQLNETLKYSALDSEWVEQESNNIELIFLCINFL